ncbi:twin-arginine translocase TatA/TatE family subunit [Hyalangium minutum]|jgi:sec-independent protein translocase protein TatA|uniref:Sec-independent protein translocase protein TatA n=1 Tax=Hyalangium minutum TaxID=394096 RepID=A0A085W3A5_9BACT|nr:twin-arginine translocase TatA/TatE family subunit [Hyalangium minutum]KFE62168.1 Twin-arginine translocation protein TatA [Hyalangium minutum]
MGGLRMPELLLIFGALLLLFGGSRLPQLGASLGSAIRNFKRGFGGENNEQAPAEQKPQGQPGTLASATTVDPNAQAKTPSHQG